MSTETVNLSEIDTGGLPKGKAVYAIFAQDEDSGEPINCRYVGETEDLAQRTRDHFSTSEQNLCLRKFMQSSKVKLMIYELMPNSTREDRLKKQAQWIKKYNPECNE